MTRLNLASLVREGAKVEVWDCSTALGNDRDAARVAGFSSAGVAVRRFTDLADAARAVGADRGDDRLFICLVARRRETIALYRALTQTGARYALLLADVQPFGDTSVRSHRTGLIATTVAAIRSRRFIHRLWLGWLGIKPPDLIIAAGAQALATDETAIADSDTPVLWAHTLDYDRFLELHAARGSKRGIVFLDQFLEGHPDQIRLGVPFCDPATYSQNLRRAFDAMEQSLGDPVVIAAHPRADYGERDPRFGGREIVRGRTAELVTASKWVIAHDSTAVGYAVLGGTPVTFLTDDGIQRSGVRREAADGLARLLGRRLYNLDRDPLPTWEGESRIDPAAYRSYRTAFLKRDGSPQKPLWTIVMSYLRQEIPAERFSPRSPLVTNSRDRS